jgi:uncharacterized membrane protein YphA (DoxX/SURF4 family)
VVITSCERQGTGPYFFALRLSLITGQGGMELVTLLGTLALTLVLCGAGRYSLDARMGNNANP